MCEGFFELIELVVCNDVFVMIDVLWKMGFIVLGCEVELMVE